MINRQKSGVNGQKNINFESDLNDEQLDVVNNLSGNMLILAGAGSGKTRTLTYSVAKLIKNGVDPRQIMLVTFTNKAAEEMMKRVKELLGEMPSITAGTFHSIANRFLNNRFLNFIYTSFFLIHKVYKSYFNLSAISSIALKKSFLFIFN